MSYHLIQLYTVGLIFPAKTCFDHINATIASGARIALMGRNGSGKSSLLSILQGTLAPTSGRVSYSPGVRIASVPQLVPSPTQSGGEAFQSAFSHALAEQPDVILLDEPTNHLDASHRRTLLRWIQSWRGTLVMASHDPELLRTCADTIWHLEDEKMHIFNGSYEDYQRERGHRVAAVTREVQLLKRAENAAHEALMHEQGRAKTSRKKGEKSIEARKWPTITAHAKARRAEETSGRKKQEILEKKQVLCDRLAALRAPEVIRPPFSLCAAEIGARSVVTIQDGAVGWGGSLAHNIHISLRGGERLAILGKNGVGKTTLLKAIGGHMALRHGGTWSVPSAEDIGYLDQHYGTLDPAKTVLEMAQDVRPEWTHAEARRHLNTFLFRSQDEVMALTETLSGGEKARLSLCLIGARTPRLLILDEVTNNLDLETRAHVVQVLTDYPGALIVVSHDAAFLDEIGITQQYELVGGAA